MAGGEGHSAGPRTPTTPPLRGLWPTVSCQSYRPKVHKHQNHMCLYTHVLYGTSNVHSWGGVNCQIASGPHTQLRPS